MLTLWPLHSVSQYICKDEQYLSIDKMGFLADSFCLNICCEEYQNDYSSMQVEECFFTGLLVLLGTCFISSFLVRLMNFQLSEPPIHILHAEGQGEQFFLIAREVNNSEQC